MIGDIIQCENAGCEEMFTKKTHNQRYHNDECCRLATNIKIKEKYYAKRAQKLGHARHCDTCSALLSRYNPDSTCNSCLRNSELERNKETATILNAISWAV